MGEIVIQNKGSDEAADFRLIKLSEINATEAFVAGGCEPILDAVRREIEDFKADETTKSGRDEIRTFAAKIARFKVGVDDIGKVYVAEIKKLPYAIDVERKRFRDTCDSLRDAVRKPLTDFEEADARRKAEHKSAISEIVRVGAFVPGETTTDLERRLVAAEQLYIGRDFEELAGEAKNARADSIDELNARLVQSRKADAERETEAQRRAELAAQLQRERDARIVAETEARVKLQAEREKTEAVEAARREAVLSQPDTREESKPAPSQAPRYPVSSYRTSAQAAPAQTPSAASEPAAPGLGMKRACIEAAQALVAFGMDDNQAKMAIKAIVNNKVPHVVINY